MAKYKNGAFVHDKAHVEEAHIGARTKVWQFASVIRGARIGEDCSIATCAIIDGSKLGDRVIVSHGAFIDPGIVIGNDVFIGPCVMLCNDAWPTVDKDGFDLVAMIEARFVTTRIEDGASVGAGVVVLPGVVIGAGSMISAGSVVECSVPPKHLHKRNGMMVPIEDRKVKRMRPAA